MRPANGAPGKGTMVGQPWAKIGWKKKGVKGATKSKNALAGNRTRGACVGGIHVATTLPTLSSSLSQGASPCDSEVFRILPRVPSPSYTHKPTNHPMVGPLHPRGGGAPKPPPPTSWGARGGAPTILSRRPRHPFPTPLAWRVHRCHNWARELQLNDPLPSLGMIGMGCGLDGSLGWGWKGFGANHKQKKGPQTPYPHPIAPTPCPSLVRRFGPLS